MGRLAEKYRREFSKALQSKIIPFAALESGQRKADSKPGFDQLVQEGRHPLHALYASVTNLVATFVEETIDLPFLHRAYSFLEKAEDTYTPGYPPMSPITVSYHVNWTFFDVGFGLEKETLGECFLSLFDLIPLDAVTQGALRNLCQSRVGVYAVAQNAGSYYVLRELVRTGNSALCFPPDLRAGQAR